MEVTQKVLTAYNIYPLHVEKITGNVHKINDGKRDYALKRSSLTGDREIKVWKHVYEQAYYQNLVSILPVYLTNERQLYTIQNENVYYVTPWLEAADTQKEKKTIEQFYRLIGNIHLKTKQVHTVHTSEFLPGFQKYAAYCDHLREELLGFVEQFEKNRYMSPFELTVCTHYRDVDFALKEMQRRVDLLMDIEEETISWNYSICHFNLRFDHMLKTRRLHLINWEKARYENASLDLAAFFKNESKNFHAATDDIIELFSIYMNENELTKTELYILSIYLLDPSPYINMVQKYNDGRSGKSMMTQTKILQHTYRQILFALKWSKFVEDEFETLEIDDIES
jgi:spore coat protein YsxE